MSRWNALLLLPGPRPPAEIERILSNHAKAGVFDDAEVIRGGKVLRFFGEPVRRFFARENGRYSLDGDTPLFEPLTPGDLYEMLSKSEYAYLVECHS